MMDIQRILSGNGMTIVDGRWYMNDRIYPDGGVDLEGPVTSLSFDGSFVTIHVDGDHECQSTIDLNSDCCSQLITNWIVSSLLLVFDDSGGLKEGIEVGDRVDQLIHLNRLRIEGLYK